MVVWSSLEISCPICQRRLPGRLVGGGFASGQDSDLLVRMKGKHVIQAEVHSCRRCHFSGYPQDFHLNLTDEQREGFLRTVTPRLREAVPDHIPRRKSRKLVGKAKGSPHEDPTPLPDLQYFWAAATAEALGFSSTSQGMRLLRAYWCTRLPPSNSLNAETLERLRKTYLRGSISKLRHGLRHERDANLLYLIGELCRRNENFLLSASYFRRYLRQDGGPSYLREAAEKLLVFALERCSRSLTMEEVLYDVNPR